MKLTFTRRVCFSILFFSAIATVPLGCTLNPLNGMITNLSVKIISPNLPFTVKVQSQDQVHLFSTAPSTVASDTGDYDCLAFNTTGYGIESSAVNDGEFPLSFFQFGAETPMQNPENVTDLVFQIEFPSLIGIDPELQKRMIQAYGVFTSNADKTACEGKLLSAFLINEDPLATVYRIGSGYYPNAEGLCSESDICIVNETKSEFGGPELINSAAASSLSNNPKKILVWPSGMIKGLSLFEDDDLNSSGSIEISSGATATTNPLGTNRVSRVDLYFEVSDLYRGRLANFSTNLVLSAISAQEFQISGASCTTTPVDPTKYSMVSVKYWDAENLRWASLPRKAGSVYSDVLAATSHSSYTIDNLDLRQIQRTLINGKKYVILSIRANNSDCVRMSVSPFSRISI